MVLGIVPTSVVNSSMNVLQSTTMLLVSGISIILAVMVLILVIQKNRTKLQKKDKELLARDELFSKLSVNVDDVFLMVDAKNMSVEYVSPNIEKLVGVSQQQVLSDIYELEQIIRTKDKKINQKLEDAVHNAESANRAKTAFLNNMSHDIRTPMNAIIGFTNIALKQEPKPEVRGCLEKIGDSSEHLLTLINDVLDISRIESGKTKFSPVPTDITEVSDVVTDITNGFLSNREIEFEVRREKPENPYVLADAARIREVLVNILGNAVKFTNDGGRITFETTYHPGEDDRHFKVRYCVTDTGVGMSEEFVKHIFDEFSQEESSARTHYKGTGLGMAITKRYVDLMKGTILVESKKGEGSTFVVELPLEVTDESRVQKQEAPSSGVNLKNMKVLLAEDNDMNAEIAMLQLEEQGMKVTRVADGKEVVECFRDSKAGAFDIILMDIMMPE